MVVVVLGVERSEKFSKSNKKSASLAYHYGIELPCLPCLPYVVLMLFFTAMTMCGLIRIRMALYGFALYGLKWPCVALYGLFWSFMAEYCFFSRGHRSKFIWSCFLK